MKSLAMFSKVLYCILISFVLGSQWTNARPDLNITKCNTKDFDCITRSTKAFAPRFLRGIPELGVQPMDPFHVESMNAGNPNLKMLIKNVVFKGLSKCNVEKLEIVNSKFITNCTCNLVMRGEYEMEGNLLFIPISGSGKMRAFVNQVGLLAETSFKEVNGADGKKHWKVKHTNSALDIKKNTTSKIEFDKLFSTNKILGFAISETLAQHSNLILAEIGVPAMNSLSPTVGENINKFFEAYAINELTLDGAN